MIDYKLLLDREELRKYCTTGTKVLLNFIISFTDVLTFVGMFQEWEPLKIPEKSDLTTLDPYEYIYCRYEYSEESGGTDPQLLPLYKRWPKTVLNGENASKYFPTVAAISTDKVGSTRNPLANRDDHSNSGSSVDSEGERTGHEVESVIFRGVDRLKLIHMIITDFGIAGCHLDPMQLLKDRCILAYSPLHDMVELRALQAEWIQLLALPWNQPVFAIKDYFGEKIGLYFVWLGQYTSWLIIAAFLGFLTWIFIAVESKH